MCSGTSDCTASTPIPESSPVTGSILQGDNAGASAASLSGTLSAVNYPCFQDITLSISITGTAIVLNMVAPNGAVVGQIGSPNAAAAAVTARSDGSGFFGFGGNSGVSRQSQLVRRARLSVKRSFRTSPRDPGRLGSLCYDLIAAKLRFRKSGTCRSNDHKFQDFHRPRVIQGLSFER